MVESSSRVVSKVRFSIKQFLVLVKITGSRTIHNGSHVARWVHRREGNRALMPRASPPPLATQLTQLDAPLLMRHQASPSGWRLSFSPNRTGACNTILCFELWPDVGSRRASRVLLVLAGPSGIAYPPARRRSSTKKKTRSKQNQKKSSGV